MALIVMYDIEENKIRNRVIDILKDYGLERIQYSVFGGELNKNMREEMVIEIKRFMRDKKGDIQVVLVNNEDFYKRIKIVEGI